MGDDIPDSETGFPIRGIDETNRRAADAIPPVESWNPPFLGDIDMHIAADGTWYYQGTPVKRDKMVRLFSRILHIDEEGRAFLVTPVEKVGISLEDAPFVAVRLEVENRDSKQVLTFETNVGDVVCVDADHPIRFSGDPTADGLRPYVRVRGRLEALVTRALVFDLVDHGCVEKVDGQSQFGIWSSGTFFSMAPTRALGC